MDEISSSDDSIVLAVGPEDNNPLYVQIGCLLNESVNEVLMKASLSRLQDHVASTSWETSINIPGRMAAIIKVPDDFLRIVSIEDKAFQRPITSLAVEGDDMDKRQHNKFLVAKEAKPVAVIGYSPEYGRIVTCYSYDSNSSPAPVMRYIKRYDNGSDTMADVCLDEYLIDIVSWVCAGKVFAALGDSDRVKLCDVNAVSLMA